MHNPHGNKRRIRATHIFGLTATLALLLACAVRVDAAVFILDFRATGEEDRVVLEWETAQEIDNVGFNLYRAEVAELSRAQKLNQALIPSQCFGEPFCASPYTYTDDKVTPGVTYYYWLESVDSKNNREFYSYDPVSATPGPSPTATPTSRPTQTPTSSPTATPTSTSTNLPTATATSTPTGVASATSTRAPTATRTSPPGTTPSVPPSSAPTGVSSHTPSIVATGEAPTETAPTTSVETPSAMATGHAVVAPTEPGATPSGSARTGWPAISMPTILIFVSVASFLGVLLLSMVLVLVRKLGL